MEQTRKLSKDLWTEMNAHERTFSLAESGNPFSQDSFNNIMDELLESFQREQIIARKVMNELPSKEFNELAADFTHLIQVEHEDEKNQRRASIKAHIIQACDVYDKDPLKQQKLDSRLKILSQHLDPLVAKIEMRLLDVKGKTHAHQWTKALIAQTIKQAVDGEALEMTSFFGDLAMQMGCNFAHAAPWLEKFQLLWSNTIKGTVNQSASAAMEGYRVSPDELAKTTTETLEAKLSKNDKSGLDPDKVSKFFFGTGEAPKTDCKKDLDVMAKQLYELTMLYFPKGSVKQNAWNWAVRAFGLGNTPDHLKKILTTFHEALFGMRLINLSRIEKIVDCVNSKLEKTTPQTTPPKSIDEPRVPPTPSRRNPKL